MPKPDGTWRPAGGATTFVAIAAAAVLAVVEAGVDVVEASGALVATAVATWAVLEALTLAVAVPLGSVEPKSPRPGEPARVRVALRGAAQLLYQASGGTLDVVKPAADGVAELRFTPPRDARPGSRYLISVTDAKTRVTAFVEVSVP